MEVWKFTNNEINSEKEKQEEKDYVLRVFSDPEYELQKEDLIMPSWDDDGSKHGSRIFSRVGYGKLPRASGKEIAIRHKNRIYNNNGEIVFDGSNPEGKIPNRSPQKEIEPMFSDKLK